MKTKINIAIFIVVASISLNACIEEDPQPAKISAVQQLKVKELKTADSPRGQVK